MEQYGKLSKKKGVATDPTFINKRTTNWTYVINLMHLKYEVIETYGTQPDTFLMEQSGQRYPFPTKKEEIKIGFKMI